MSTPAISSSTQPNNYQCDENQSTQLAGISDLLSRPHPNGTLSQLLHDYQSRMRLASHNSLSGNATTILGNRRGSEIKASMGSEATNGARSLLDSEFPHREGQSNFNANRLTTIGNPARGYSANRRLWSPLGHNVFPNTDQFVPRNKSPVSYS